LIHYHCADISGERFLELAGHHLLVSFAYPRRVRDSHDIAQTVCLDCGAFTVWQKGVVMDWNKYYAWVDEFLAWPTTWAIIPDVINGGEDANNALLAAWPHEEQGAPVWHLDESVDRLLKLIDGGWPKVCLGSAGEYAKINSDSWLKRMFIVFNKVDKTFQRMPWLHGLRMQGIACAENFPFASVDSADIARNNHLKHHTVKKMAERWDKQQPRFPWHQRLEQQEFSDFLIT